jgi:hypothetical protein
VWFIYDFIGKPKSPTPIAVNPNEPPVTPVDPKPTVADPKKPVPPELRTAAYDQYPEPFKSRFNKEWKKEAEAAWNAIAADESALKDAKTDAEREKYEKFIKINTDRLARLQRNDPPYASNEAAIAYAKFRRESTDKDVVAAREERRKMAEAEAQEKDEANRKEYEVALAAYEKKRKDFDLEVIKAKTDYAKKQEKYKAEKDSFDKATKWYQTAKTEYEACREFNLHRTLYDVKATKEAGRKRFRELISKYPDTQAAKDAKTLLDDDFAQVKVRTPIKPGSPPAAPAQPSWMEPIKPDFASPAEPAPVKVVYRDVDPESQALFDAAKQSKAAKDSDAAALREASAQATRRVAEEYDVDGLVLLKNTVTDSNGVITGTVVNRGKRRDAEIRFGLFDNTGAQVGAANDTVKDLERGDRWTFRVVTDNNCWRSYKLLELKAP